MITHSECYVWQEYAPGCPHYFDGYNYVKHDYLVMVEGQLRHAWPNAGMLHAGGAYLRPEDGVICWIDPHGRSGAVRDWAEEQKKPWRQRFEEW